MSLNRTFTRTVSRMLIGVLLFAQFAVASYACPGLKGMTSMSSTPAGTVMVAHSASEPAAMPPGCDQMDPDAANLCAEHCHQGQQDYRELHDDPAAQ